MTGSICIDGPTLIFGALICTLAGAMLTATLAIWVEKISPAIHKKPKRRKL
jgi:hypothetical protein